MVAVHAGLASANAGVHLRAEQRWVCPNCTATDVTHESKPHTRFHSCRGLKGLTAPLVPDGTDCVVEAVERDDYVGKELVQSNGEGRPISAVVTRYADGSNDCAVLAPCATVKARNDGLVR
jgi:hypothetical protein